ncbi:MAG: selenocysteine-specific translation elongation factor [Acidobacteria bacterium]|nr:selenocysteine-specific translation elongation factor [Acidobacteriota bacterium]
MSVHLTLGTAGHIDHGKTTLLKALTGIDADRLKEAKERGITIDIGFAHWVDPPYTLGFVDVPGHERFVKNMLAGTGGIDGILLVIAADEGIMPQTREHFDIARLLGVRAGAVVLTKTDLADPDLLEVVEVEVAEMLAGSFLDGAPVIRFSAVTGEGLDTLKTVLRDLADSKTADREERIPRLFIDRVFTLKGFGTVVTGTVRGGPIRKNDTMVVSPAGTEAKVRNLQVHGAEEDVALPGQRAALNLSGVGHQAIERGVVLTTPSGLIPSTSILARVQLLPSFPRPVRSGVPVHFHLGSAEILARLRFLGQSALSPGEEGFARVLLESATPALPGDHFVFRQYSPLITMGGGTVLENHPEMLRRRNSLVLREQLGALGTSGETGLLRHLLGNAVGGGLALGELAALTGLPVEPLAARLAAAPPDACFVSCTADNTFWALSRSIDEAGAEIRDSLARHFEKNPYAPAIRKDEVLGRFRRLREPLVRHVLDRLAQAGHLRADDERLTLPGRPEDLARRHSAFLEALDQFLRDAGPTGVDRESLEPVLTRWEPAAPGALLDYALQTERVIRVHDGFYLHPAILDAFVSTLRANFSRETVFDAATVRDLVGLSRKPVIDLLEFLDRRGVTLRIGNGRRLK